MHSHISSTHKSYLDILRIIASFFVCYNHAYGYHLFLDQAADGSLLSWMNVCLSSPVAINVPLFFMISGALLLNKTECYPSLLRRLWRMVVLITAASVVTYILVPVEQPSLPHFLSLFFSGTVNGSHWYLFAYVSFLLLLPFLRPAVQKMTGTDLLYLVILRTIFRPGLAILNFWLEHWGYAAIRLSVNLQFPLSMLDCFFCPIAGYWLAHKLCIERISRKQLSGWVCVLLGGCLIASLMTYAEGYYDTFTQNYIGEFGYSSAMAVFVLIRYFTEKVSISPKTAALLSNVSSVTLGIFLLEPIVVHYFYGAFFARIPWHPVIITFFSVVWCVVCMATGGCITWMLRKIPGVRRYL